MTGTELGVVQIMRALFESAPVKRRIAFWRKDHFIDGECMTEDGRTYKGKGLVLSLGSINADFQVRVERRPQPSETLEAADFVRLSGGKAANVSYFARLLDLPSSLMGHVGDDDLAEQALAPLREVGVDIDEVKKIPGQSTGVSMITVPPDGKKGIVLASNANRAWSRAEVDQVVEKVYAASSEAVLVLDCEVPVFVLEQAAAAAKEKGIKVIIDPSPADKVTDALIAMADFITPNAGEARKLTRITCEDFDSAACAGDKLIELGAKAACIKLSDGGCVFVRQEECLHIVPTPVEVNDTTGAGDAFAGALAVALTEQKSDIDAVRFAVAASHLAVTGYGSQTALPKRGEIEDLMKKLDVQYDELHSH